MMPAADLAEHVRTRRHELGLPVDLSPYGGPTEMTVRALEAATARPRSKTLRDLDTALRWRPGSALALLRTGELPEPLAHEPAQQVPDDVLALRIGRVVLALIRAEGR